MAITTGDGYIAAAKQVIPYTKAAVTTVAFQRYTVAQAAGNPGSASIVGAATPGGGVPVDGQGGSPLLTAFGGGNTGYLTRVQWAVSVAERLELWDKVYSVGIATAQFAAAIHTETLSSQPSYLARTPDGVGKGLRIFVEITTTMSATATTVNVTYNNQAGAGKTAVATASLSGFVAGRWVELSLAAGDSGVQQINSVIIGGASNAAGVANIIVARPLWTNGARIVNANGVDGIDRTGMPVVYDSSCLVMTTVADSTSSGVPDLNLEIANG